MREQGRGGCYARHHPGVFYSVPWQHCSVGWMDQEDEDGDLNLRGKEDEGSYGAAAASPDTPERERACAVVAPDGLPFSSCFRRHQLRYPLPLWFCCSSVPVAGNTGGSDSEIAGGGMRLWWLLMADAQRLWPATGGS